MPTAMQVVALGQLTAKSWPVGRTPLLGLGAIDVAAAMANTVYAVASIGTVKVVTLPVGT